MRHHLVSSLRFLGASLAALALSACARLAPPMTLASPPEPRFSDAPPAEQLAADTAARDDDARLAALEVRLASIEAEIVNLRKALDVLGPLPDHADLFIPVDLSELEDASPAATQVLIAHAGLGCFAARADTPEIVDPLGIAYDGLDEGMQISISDDAAFDALCVELSALTGPARAVVPIRAW
jgi:hypothetical protein